MSLHSLNNTKSSRNRKKRRVSTFKRSTKETTVQVRLDIDGDGNSDINTSIPFLDHLISTFSKHSMINIQLNAKSNDQIIHHLIEDIAITISQGIDKALGDRIGIKRFGYAIIPMDDVLVFASLDLIKRQFHKTNISLTRHEIENIHKEDLEHFIESLLQNLNACVHIKLEYGENDHHKIEAAIKALAVSLRLAVNIDKKRSGIPSTKNMM
ncbi:MAG: imidazoleglycerol-phosphate dehydratase [Nitrososphaeraceae archaeon]